MLTEFSLAKQHETSDRATAIRYHFADVLDIVPVADRNKITLLMGRINHTSKAAISDAITDLESHARNYMARSYMALDEAEKAAWKRAAETLSGYAAGASVRIRGE